MSRSIFVNLPVADVGHAVAFYAALGFERNPQFSSHDTACMVLSETIYVMLLEKPRFAAFTPKEIADASRVTEVLVALSTGSRAEVDETVARAVAAGGRPDPGPIQEHGFMYGRSVEDPDGHIVELFWMDMAAVPAEAESA